MIGSLREPRLVYTLGQVFELVSVNVTDLGPKASLEMGRKEAIWIHGKQV